jgi:hypothetical protein
MSIQVGELARYLFYFYGIPASQASNQMISVKYELGT